MFISKIQMFILLVCFICSWFVVRFQIPGPSPVSGAWKAIWKYNPWGKYDQLEQRDRLRLNFAPNAPSGNFKFTGNENEYFPNGIVFDISGVLTSAGTVHWVMSYSNNRNVTYDGTINANDNTIFRRALKEYSQGNWIEIGWFSWCWRF